MLADKTERTPDDLTRVNLSQEWEVRYWCARLSVSAEELRACIMVVGPLVNDVEKRLKEAGRVSFKLGGED